MSQNFQNLKVWEDAISFHKTIVPEISKFPKEEIYAMSSQLRRASLSISNNIAEGCGRESSKELRNFLNIAMGSCKEVENMIIVAKELYYISIETHKELMQKIITIGKKLNSLMQKVSLSINKKTTPKAGEALETKNQKPKTKNTGEACPKT
jgi:four helix bundle protein